MATKVKSSADDLYAADFVAWTQARPMLCARRFDELDLVNLIEEVEDLGATGCRHGQRRCGFGAARPW